MLTGRRLRRKTNPIPAARSVTLTVQSAPGGASLSALKEGKSKVNKCPFEIRYDAVRVRNDQLATLKQHGGRRRRPSGLGSICVSGDRCGDAVSFSLPKGGNATDAGKRKGIGRKSRGNSCQRKHPAEILALGPSCVSHRRSSNANSLGGQNSAGSLPRTK